MWNEKQQIKMHYSIKRKSSDWIIFISGKQIFNTTNVFQFSSVQFSRSVMSNSLQPPGLQNARPPCPSPTPRAYSNSCPLSRWCHPIISSSVVPFSSHLQSFPASGSFQMNQFFASGGQSIGVSASPSILPTNIQDWFPLRWTSWISLQSKGLKSFSNTTVQKHQFNKHQCLNIIYFINIWKYTNHIIFFIFTETSFNTF